MCLSGGGGFLSCYKRGIFVAFSKNCKAWGKVLGYNNLSLTGKGLMEDEYLPGAENSTDIANMLHLFC